MGKKKSVVDQAEEEYAVEAILLSKKEGALDVPYYFVKWEHWSIEDSTWEPISNLEHSAKLVRDFEENIKSKLSKEQQEGAEPRYVLVKIHDKRETKKVSCY